MLDKSFQPATVGAVNSAIAIHAVRGRWLSSLGIMRYALLIFSWLLLQPLLCMAWPPLDDVLASRQAKTNMLAQPMELEFIPQGDAGKWVGGHSKRKAIVRSVDKERWRSGADAWVVKLDGEGSNFWFEAIYKEKLPSLDDVLKANSVEGLDKLFGQRSNWGDGYDGGGRNNKYYYFSLQPGNTLSVFLVEIETAGFAKGELRVWTASCNLPK